jgi:dihydroorotase-like cyclic amidohydrolase
MKTIIKSALIIDPRSTHHGKKRDILIENNIITKIAAKIEEKKAKDAEAARDLAIK